MMKRLSLAICLLVSAAPLYADDAQNAAIKKLMGEIGGDASTKTRTPRSRSFASGNGDRSRTRT